jgi:lipoprotein-anchoring transpeptidase ErfK/SrfK
MRATRRTGARGKARCAARGARRYPVAPMKRLLAGSLLFLLLAAAPAGAQEPLIRPGVSAGGVDLSSLTVVQAAAKLQVELAPRLAGDLVIVVRRRPRRLRMTTAKFTFDPIGTAQRALLSQPPVTQVPPAIRHSGVAVAKFVNAIARRVDRPAREASIRITLARIFRRPARWGGVLPIRATRKLINDTLDDALAPRLLKHRMRPVRPRIRTRDLRRVYNTVITIDKAHFRLRLFKRLRPFKSYPVAVGQPAFPTPSGLFSITSKQVDPVWSVPNSPWAGELAGTTVQGGSLANPLKARWMGIANGVGIHGTGEDASIGTRASHGCIRMHVSDVIDLYRRVPIGSPVLIR